MFLYGATGKNAQPYVGAEPAGTSIGGLTTCTTYRVTVQAISSSSTVQSSVESGKIAVTTQCNAALVPAFGTPTPTADGYAVQITNYDAAFTWTAEVTAGTATIDNTGLATVTGLTTDASQTLTVTTTRATYSVGSATVSGARNSTPSQWIGSGDFTVELWVKPTSDWNNPGRQELFVLTPTLANARLDIWYQGGAWQIYAESWVTSGTAPAVSMSPPSTTTWTHVALTRQSGIMRLYVAGTKVAESASAVAGDASVLNRLLLGADPNSFSCKCNLATALLSNVRVVDGTALYTGTTLTVPTAPLSQIAGTTFLLSQAVGAGDSIVLDGATRYEQTITTTNGVPALSTFDTYLLVGGQAGSWSTSTVVTSTDSPFSS